MKKILFKRYVHTWKEYSNDKLKKCILFCMLVCVSWQVFTFCLLFYLLQRLPYGRNQNIGNASAFASSLLCKQWLQSWLKEYAFFIITKLLSYVYNQTYNKGVTLWKGRSIMELNWHLRSATPEIHGRFSLFWKQTKDFFLHMVKNLKHLSKPLYY